jgi:hypothetical protein
MKVDLSYLAWLYRSGAAKQRGQHLSAYLPVRTPAVSARRIVFTGIPGPEFHASSGRKGIPDPPLGIG